MKISEVLIYSLFHDGKNDYNVVNKDIFFCINYDINYLGRDGNHSIYASPWYKVLGYW